MNKPAGNQNNNPAGLETDVQKARMEKLRQELARFAVTNTLPASFCQWDPELQQAFMDTVFEQENQEGAVPLEVMAADGFVFPPSEKLGDQELTTKLWELIRELGRRRVFLDHTNHLSDRELYDWLVDDKLSEEVEGFGQPGSNFDFDVLGQETEEDLILSMRYYTDELERGAFAADYPGFPMPPIEQPPYDRDQHLPRWS